MNLKKNVQHCRDVWKKHLVRNIYFTLQGIKKMLKMQRKQAKVWEYIWQSRY